MKQFLALCAIIAICVAEAPLSGPYPASGWKPKGAQFTLPRQFLPEQQQRQNQASEIEITKEQVNFAGQSTETQPANEDPVNDYVQPDRDYVDESATENTVYLKVQGLPTETSSQFSQPQNGQLNQYRSNKNRQFGRLQQKEQQNYNFNRQQQFGRILQLQDRLQFQQQQQQQQLPAPEYGPPKNAPVADSEVDEEEVIQDSDENEQPVIAVSNSVQNGRYYVLTPDNTLQRVVFMTSQNEEEVRSKGFTAQLRYMPVEPIRDPIYAYNEEGSLVRIYRK